MKKWIGMPLILAALVATDTSAQQFEVFRRQPGAWLGFWYDRVAGAERGRVAVQDVAQDSPAERAGLQVGDTVLSVNGLAATEQLLGSLGAGLAAGDTVRLRVRREGRERDVVIVAAQRPPDYPILTYRFDTDTLRSRVRILVDSAFRQLDTLRYVLGRDARFHFADSLANLRNLHFYADTLANPRNLRIYVDSLRSTLDSLHFPRAYVWSDSMGPGFHTYGRWFGPDTSLFRAYTLAEPFGITMWGRTAIAGAELAPVAEDLGEYFNVDAGVLVLRIHDGTPAARAGLRAGDVILRAGNQDVRSIDALRTAIQRSRPGTTVHLDVMRRGNRMTIELGRD